MRRAVRRWREVLFRMADDVGPEGAFVGGGALLLAIGTSYLSPAGPWLVLGSLFTMIGLALAVPKGR